MLCFLRAGLLSKAVADAHARTCLFTNDQIEQMRAQSYTDEQLEMFRQMVSLSDICVHLLIVFSLFTIIT